VAFHDKLDAKQRQGAAQFYSDAAMRLLRDAVSQGHKDAAHMKKDTGLDPLRQRQDFQNLVAESSTLLYAERVRQRCRRAPLRQTASHAPLP
jgi:hypothetical protein